VSRGTGQREPGRDSLQPRVVWLEKDLEQLVTRFLQRKEADVQRMRAALAEDDFELIARAGHDLKGAGEGFGFPELSVLGAQLELAARSRDRELLETHFVTMERFLKRIQVRFN